jgi:hypothetical protein
MKIDMLERVSSASRSDPRSRGGRVQRYSADAAGPVADNQRRAAPGYLLRRKRFHGYLLGPAGHGLSSPSLRKNSNRFVNDADGR